MEKRRRGGRVKETQETDKQRMQLQSEKDER